MSMNQYWQSVQYINLVRRADRRESFESQPFGDVIRRNGITPEDLIDMGYLGERMRDRLQHYGIRGPLVKLCVSLAHQRCVREAYDAGYENCFVFEDDAVAALRFTDRIHEVHQFMPECDVFLYGCTYKFGPEWPYEITEDNRYMHVPYSCAWYAYGLRNRRVMKAVIDEFDTFSGQLWDVKFRTHRFGERWRVMAPRVLLCDRISGASDQMMGKKYRELEAAEIEARLNG
mgnify:CR=1 FL=1